ncbi:MAG: OsmC family protein [Firmicutes bacterium]|nr:OsmC family protein [Bacillota bacterium]HOB34442.1 OsmC family protein [Bacillota bacterium]HPZ89818.1 OsmC family protein [Bacillota bacterium]HQE01166.1 OsmC family protein [Bacillota bacterium]
MEVKLTLNNSFFEGTNARGARIKLGPGLDDGVSPMEAVLLAAGGCSGLDVVSILGKMRQPLQALEIQVVGERQEEHPRYFRTITIKYLLKGNLDPEKVKHAIELSLNKYCSVTNGLAPKARITYAFEISGGNE